MWNGHSSQENDGRSGNGAIEGLLLREALSVQLSWIFGDRLSQEDGQVGRDPLRSFKWWVINRSWPSS